MATKGHVMRWLRSGRTDRVAPELDPIRSQYPDNIASGYWKYGASTDKTSVLLVPSSYRFNMQQVWLDTSEGEKNKVVFYDGPGVSVTVGPIQVNGSNTAFVDNLKGLFFASAVHTSVLSSGITIRVAGLLLRSE